jgi:hypothetical protein
MTTKSEGRDSNAPQAMTDGGPKWTQDQAVAYECARDCITHLMSCYSALIEDGLRRDIAPLELDAYEREIKRLAQERQELRVHDDVAIERIRKEYGQLVKEMSARIGQA